MAQYNIGWYAFSDKYTGINKKIGKQDAKPQNFRSRKQAEQVIQSMIFLFCRDRGYTVEYLSCEKFSFFSVDDNGQKALFYLAPVDCEFTEATSKIVSTFLQTNSVKA